MNESQNGEKNSGYRFQDDEFENALIAGTHAGMLEAYLGEAEYEELRKWAQAANRAGVRGGPRVIILPGIMGSKIGRKRLIFDDVLWIDPLEIAVGRLSRLALGKKATRYEPVGVILLAYLKLKLRLKAKGFDAEFYPFDWRLDLKLLGKQLADYLRKEKHRKVNLIAHSMGGLVARSAIAHKAPKIRRLIMLGTPNHGSFVPVQAIRGVYPIVRKFAALDLKHSADELSSDVFSTFPGLYQMLPWKEKFDSVDLYDINTWPPKGPRPRTAILKNAPASQEFLAPASDRFFLIAGVNQETVVGLKREGSEFIYESSVEGDGTVPLEFAKLPDIPTYYIEESHGSLPNNATVAQAVSDLLKFGSTERLPDAWTPSRRGVIRMQRDIEIQETEIFDGRQGKDIRPSEIRNLLEEWVAPTRVEEVKNRPQVGAVSATAAVSGFSHEFSHLVVSRRRQHRIDIRLAFGSIADVDSRAYVLGIFRDVEPSGPARVLNDRLDGLITEFTTRRMLTGNAGDVFLMPAGRYALMADMILFAGLGSFDQFSDESQQLCAENTIRTFIRSRTDEFATVLLGSGSVRDTARSLENILTGFFRGLLDADRDRRFRRITICEYDRKRYDEIKQELFRLSSTSLFDEIEVTIDEITLPITVEPTRVPRYPVPTVDPVYLIVRKESQDKQKTTIRSSVLTSGAKAAVITEYVDFPVKQLGRYLRKIETNQFNFEKMGDFGDQLARLVLAPKILDVLKTMKGRPMVVVHDACCSRIPWETICIMNNQWFPAIQAGISRRYMADNLSVAKWSEKRRYGKVLDLLLVVNPTEDLDGAEEEGNRIRQLFGSHPWVKINELRGPKATKQTLSRKFRSGRYDVVHYAGHAFFDLDRPAQSGIVCYGDQVLSGSELAGFGNLPGLVFFNACESGRIRKRGDQDNPRIDVKIDYNVSLAEAFMRGGIANYVGTYWPVGDDEAKAFAETFYPALLNGKTISEALLEARKAVWNLSSVDWADYIHYGSPSFVLKFTE